MRGTSDTAESLNFNCKHEDSICNILPVCQVINSVALASYDTVSRGMNKIEPLTSISAHGNGKEKAGKHTYIITKNRRVKI